VGLSYVLVNNASLLLRKFVWAAVPKETTTNNTQQQDDNDEYNVCFVDQTQSKKGKSSTTPYLLLLSCAKSLGRICAVCQHHCQLFWVWWTYACTATGPPACNAQPAEGHTPCKQPEHG